MSEPISLPTEPSTVGVTFVGGDMFEWSDFRPGTKGAAEAVPPGHQIPEPSPLWAELFGAALQGATGPVLLAGPEAAKCLPLLPTDAVVDVLVRARSDAAQLSLRFPNAQLYCGSARRFEPRHKYALVLTLGPLSELFSPDEGAMPELAAAKLVAGWAAPGAAHVVRMRNALPVDDLVSVASPAQPQWAPAEAGLSVNQLGDLPAGEVASLFGREPRMCTLFSSARRQPGLAGWAAASAVAAQPADVVRDPWVLLPELAAADRLVEFSSAWLWTHGIALPDLALTELNPALAAGWRRDLLAADGQINWVGSRRISLAALARAAKQSVEFPADAVPFTTELRAVCATQQPEELRPLLSRWSAWVETLPAELAPFAGPENVASGEQLQLIDASWSLTGVPIEVSKLVGLRQLAVSLLDSGAIHPWPAVISVDALTEGLALMAGIDDYEGLRKPALVAQARIDLLSSVGSTSGLEDRVSALRAAGGVPVTSPGSAWGRIETAKNYSKIAAERLVQQEQLAWAQSHIRWQDKQLNRQRREMAKYRRSLYYRGRQLLLWPLHKAESVAVRLAKKYVPQGAVDKLKALLKGAK